MVDNTYICMYFMEEAQFAFNDEHRIIAKDVEHYPSGISGSIYTKLFIPVGNKHL